MPRFKKRVLFVVSQPFFQWRGSPIRVGFDVQALVQLGYVVDLLVPPFGEDPGYQGVTIVRTRSIPGVRNLPIGPSISKILFDVLLLLRARSMLRNEVYTCLHGVEDTGAVCAWLARRYDLPFVFEKHSDPRSYRKGYLRNVVMRMYAAVERWTIRRATAVIGTGPKLAEYAAALCPDKTVVEIPDIPSSLAESSPECASTQRKALVKHANDILLTYVGSFAVYQGIDLLFSSIPIVCRADPRARFVIIGGSPAQIASRKEQMQQAGCAHCVHFAGLIPPDRLPDILAGSDILLSPRIAGTNTPLKILDYLKAARPIVATENEANRQILNESTAVFGAADAASYAQAMLRLVEDENLREKLGVGGMRLIQEKYNFAYFKRELGKVYEELCA